MNSSRWHLCLLILAAVAVLCAGIWLTYTLFTAPHTGGNDFYSRWVGGCALLREGMNPYSEAVTLRIQEGMYGRPARPDEDQVAFAYPLYSLLFFWPLCFTANYPLVQSIWMWLLLAGLVTAVLLWMRVIHWRPRLVVWTLTVLWSVLMYHSLRALLLGQFAVFVLLLLVLALWAMQRERDGWAGLLLALATVKPQMVYLAIPWVLLWAAGQRRWRLWWSFFGSMALLILGSMILLPSWIPDFARQAIAYPSYTVYGSLTWMIIRDLLGLGRGAEIAVMALLAVAILVLGWRLWRGDWTQMIWMVGLLLLLTNFFTPRIATTNYLLLLPWVLWGFRWMQRVWGRRGLWAAVAVEALSMVGLWVLFLVTIEGDFEHSSVYFPFPAAMTLLLVWLWGQIKMYREPEPNSHCTD
ncbi:MAG: hypothetical protein B6I35_14365 [Anaerolineaceae bacterium 4572_32.2]|nr:MAG: hypothetical protein B6I35_14365 [Anaerolineaceae bacterium 4572_32.2]